MSKSDKSKMNYTMRREIRVRRDKTAAILMATFLHGIMDRLKDHEDVSRWFDSAAERAILAADVLIARLDETRQDLAPPEPEATP